MTASPAEIAMELKIPDLGEADAEVEVIELCVAVGAEVAEGDILLVLESEKASLELPAPATGIVESLLVKEGDRLRSDALVGSLVARAEAQSATAEVAATGKSAPAAESPAESAPATAADSHEIRIPDLGEADAEVEVIELCVAAGAEVAEGDILVVLESEKASLELPAPATGTVESLRVKEGDRLRSDALVGRLLPRAEAQSATVEVAATGESAPAAEPPAESAPATAADSHEIRIPDLGEADAEVEVIELCVAAGAEVAEGDILAVLESEKASLELPAPAAGKIESLSVTEGDKLKTGTLVAILVASLAPTSAAAAAPTARKIESSTPSASAGAAEPLPQTQRSPSVAAESAGGTHTGGELPLDGRGVYAGPAVRKLAREFSIDLKQIKGSGERGRIVKQDLQNFVKQRLNAPQPSAGGELPQVPKVDFGRFGPVNQQPMTRLGRAVADNMRRSWLNVPHVTQFDEFDVEALEQLRAELKPAAARHELKLTPLPLLLKACATALLEHPKMAASLTAQGRELVYRESIHIGIAVDVPDGLLVPVIRDVDRKNLWEIAAETSALANSAREKKLRAADMQGGCFTISSLGAIGGTGFTPVINTPEASILGVSKMTVRPFFDGKKFIPRKMLPLSLSYDHRTVNGADAGRFMQTLSKIMSEPQPLAEGLER